jgi:predicted nuclease of predicted toxin-antitoxin system
MNRFLADEDFKSGILNGLKRRIPNLDIVRVQDVRLRTFRDSVILQFAASENRIVLTHDVGTMETHARARILARKPMPGLFLIHQDLPIGQAIEAVAVIVLCSPDDEWHNRIEHLPL